MFTPEQALALLTVRFPDADQDDRESYVYGKDDPEDYLSKVDGEAELFEDFEDFIKD